MITVKDVWRGALPPGTELLGGGAGLERRVEWATALRTRPPAFEAIKGGELALIPVRSLRLIDQRLDLVEVIRTFAEKGGVAVAVIGDVSAEAISVAERMMVPLLHLPASAQPTEVQQATIRFILEQRTLLHERQQQLHAQLTELALAGAGMPAIIDRLGEIVGHPVAWQERDGAVRHIACAGEPEELRSSLEADIARVRRWAESTPATAADPPVHEFRVGAGVSRLAAPIPVRDGIGGYVSMAAPDTEIDQVMRLAVARAASAAAIELDRERAVLQARDELEGEFLDSLLAGTYSSESAVRSRAERLGFALGGDALVMVARAGPPSEPLSRSRRDQLMLGAKGWIRRRAEGALAVIRQGAVTTVVPLPPSDRNGDQAPPDVRRLAADLRLELAGALSSDDVTVGIGRRKPGIGGVRASYREAQQALTMGHRLYGGGRVVGFGDLGLHRLLFAMQGQAELSEFFDDQVRPLVEYDRRTGAGLMKTLEAFFRCHGSPTEIAGILHLHRNTVLYRLRRIEEIGSLRLDDPETRLNLHLCLKVRDVLAAPPS